MALNSFDGSGQVIPDFEAYASTCFQCFGSHLDDRYPRILARWMERCLRRCFMERWLRGECMGWLALQFQGLASTVAKQRTSRTPAWDVVQVDATRFNTSERGNASLMWLNSNIMNQACIMYQKMQSVTNSTSSPACSFDFNSIQ